MNVIIFSKDRAAQLDLLLRSMPKSWRDYKFMVLFTYSNDKYNEGYEKLSYEVTWYCPEITMWTQTGFAQYSFFKKDLLFIINPDEKYTVFFTDDDIFVGDLPEIPELPDDVACLSLRLNPRMKYCYTLSRKQNVPKIVKDGDTYEWHWHAADADYGYPMSLDGHIFRTADILPLLKKLDYNNPNQLEGQLARHPINCPKMMCFDKSVIINNAINKVQTVNNNRHGDISAEWLNEQFLQGKRIDLKPFLGYDPNACHVELPISMI